MTAETLSISAKQQVLDAVTLMPDGVTYRQIRNELALLEAIREGIADLDAGRTVTHEEAMRSLSEWTTRSLGRAAH